MKKKDIITAVVIIIFITLLVGGCIFLAARKENHAEEKLINVYYPIMNGKTIYSNFGIRIIDPEIPQITDFDIDLSGLGIENFDKLSLVAGNFDGINLYFSYRHNSGISEEFQFYRYNSITREITRIEFTTGYDRNSFNNFYAHGGYLYYFAYNNVTNYEELKNQIRYLCRVPVVGGKEEVLAEYDATEEFICFVDGDSVVTSNRTSVNLFDVSKKKITEIFNAEKNGFRFIIGERSFYYRGIMYFAAEKDLPSVAEAEEGFKESRKTPDDYLIALDIKKKEWKKAVDEPISMYCLTEDRIYYVKKKYRILKLTEAPVTVNDYITVYCDGSIYSKPIGGGDEQVLYTNEKISVTQMFSVKGGRICCKINSPTETDYDYSIKFATIDFATGNITYFNIQE